MKAVIIEDEKNAQEALLNLLELIDLEIEVIGIADNIDDASKLINKTKPDIVFLDIQLKKGTGFDVIERLNDFNGKIIFTTAYEHYAIKAFKFSAFDYLLKPINPKELTATIAEAIKEIEKGIKYDEMLKVIEHNKSNKKDAKIILKTLNNQYIIPIANIIRCESEGAYTNFYLERKKLLTSKNLKYYDEILCDHGFIRTHQSHLVNSKYINRVNTDGFIEMKDGVQVPISARKKASVNKQLNSLL